MYNRKISIRDATQEWVKTFNAIPQDLILKAYPNIDEDGLEILITEKECSYCGHTEFKEGKNGILVCADCGECAEDYMLEKYDLPMWGTMWTFGESIDEEWAKNNLEIMRDCGFWVYESDELGVVFGINGAGYDFYENHWIPLYKARGLHWHDEE